MNKTIIIGENNNSSFFELVKRIVSKLKPSEWLILLGVIIPTVTFLYKFYYKGYFDYYRIDTSNITIYDLSSVVTYCGCVLLLLVLNAIVVVAIKNKKYHYVVVIYFVIFIFLLNLLKVIIPYDVSFIEFVKEAVNDWAEVSDSILAMALISLEFIFIGLIIGLQLRIPPLSNMKWKSARLRKSLPIIGMFILVVTVVSIPVNIYEAGKNAAVNKDSYKVILSNGDSYRDYSVVYEDSQYYYLVQAEISEDKDSEEILLRKIFLQHQNQVKKVNTEATLVDVKLSEEMIVRGDET